MTDEMKAHEHFMQEALKEAHKALEDDEIPIGAVVVHHNRIIARGYNQVERLHDVTAHAEMIAITSAANFMGSKYLDDCSFYVTVEPCLMCASALYWSRIKELYYGASDNRFGFTRLEAGIFGSRTKVQSGILKNPCSELILDFFKRKRELDDLGK